MLDLGHQDAMTEKPRSWSTSVILARLPRLFSTHAHNNAPNLERIVRSVDMNAHGRAFKLSLAICELILTH